MPKTIIQKLHELADAVEKEFDETHTSATGEAFSDEAVKAIMAGPLLPDGKPTPQWKSYMEHFADTPEQLARLTLQDDKKDQFVVRKSCAYIVANAVCGAISTTRTFERVAPEIEP